MIYTINNLLMVLMNHGNCNVTMGFEYLYQISEVFYNYFGTINSDKIKSNRAMIIELINESMDSGFPQITDKEILKDLIKSQKYEKNLKYEEDLNNSYIIEKYLGNAKEKEITKLITGKINLRKEGIFYEENIIYFDIDEYVTFNVNEKQNNKIRILEGNSFILIIL